jgi:hypothetical protein
MAKVIEIYARDVFPKKGKRVPREQRGKVIEFPKKKSALAAKAAKIREPDDVDGILLSYFGCF